MEPVLILGSFNCEKVQRQHKYTNFYSYISLTRIKYLRSLSVIFTFYNLQKIYDKCLVTFEISFSIGFGTSGCVINNSFYRIAKKKTNSKHSFCLKIDLDIETYPMLTLLLDILFMMSS